VFFLCPANRGKSWLGETKKLCRAESYRVSTNARPAESLAGKFQAGWETVLQRLFTTAGESPFNRFGATETDFNEIGKCGSFSGGLPTICPFLIQTGRPLLCK